MEFQAMRDYFGLSDFFTGSTKEDDSVLINVCERMSPFYVLEQIRRDAHLEFQSNGIERELDDIDVYQAQLRGQNVTDRVMLTPDIIANPPTSNSNRSSPELPNSATKEDEYVDYKKKREKAKKKNQVCVFCKNNGEQRDIYEKHTLKDDDGNITCPILYNYVCPICGKTGADAHTITYCPHNTGDVARASLLKTCRLASGKRRH